MDPHRDALHRFVRALVRRERLVLVARVALQALGLVVGLGLIAVLAAVFGWDRAAVTGVLVLVGGIGGFAAVAAPLMIGWRRSGDPLRQARRVEALRPALEGRLLTIVERLDGPRGQESAAILGLVARRATERVADLAPGRVHRSWPLALGAGGLLLALLVTLTSSVFAPGGPLGALAYWTASDGVVAGLDDVGGPGSADHARVGDLVLEYVYPTYTGLEPLEVTNSTGEAHGPPGTRVRVRARSAEPVDAASVIAYDSPGEESAVEEGRIVRGAFTITADEGTWHLELHRGDATHTSRDFAIVPEPDLAPEVIVDGPRTLEVALDEPIELPWQVRDDYGLTRVVLLIDGEETAELRAFDSERRAEATGTLSFTPQQLGMSVGMRVELRVAASDNNAWSGARWGQSEPPIDLIVRSPEDLAALGPEERLALRDTLVDLLAGQLLSPWPPGPTSADVARGGEAFDALYQPLRDFIDAHPVVRRDRFVRSLVVRVRRAGQDFVAYTQVNFDPELRTERPEAPVLAQAAELRDGAIEEVEFAVVLLDRYVQSRALGEVLEQARVLAGLGARLERELSGQASIPEIQGALDRVDRSLDRVSEAVGFMDQDSTRSMVEGRTRELALLRDEVRRRLSQDDREQATELAGRLATQMIELQEDLEYRLKRMEDEEDDLGQQVKDLVEELERLEREQRKLQQQVRDAREAGDAQGAAEAERLWERVEQLASQAVGLGNGLEEQIRSFWAREHVASANRSTGRLVESAQARDLRKARADVEDALRGWARAGRAVADARRAPILRRVEEAERILDRLDRSASSVDPRTAAQTQAMRAQQDELSQALQAARQMADEVAAKMPIEPRGMQEALEQAEGSMGDAGEDLAQGRPMPAEGAQGQAAERLKEARESLEEAAQQMAASGSRAASGEPQDAEEGGGGEANRDEVDLDGGPMQQPRDITLEEQFDLDAFQRDVLRGARGDVPDAYRALKQRYYEELMTQ